MNPAKEGIAGQVLTGGAFPGEAIRVDGATGLAAILGGL